MKKDYRPLFKFTESEEQDIQRKINEVAEAFGIEHWTYDDRRQTDVDRATTGEH